MVQREMAQRIVAPPGSRTYGRLTVAVAQHAAARILFHVRPGSFHPAPAVTSSVISLAPRAAPLAPVRDAVLFEAVVKQAFANQRPMLRGALSAAFGHDAVAAALRRPASRGRSARSSCRSPTSRASRTRACGGAPPRGRRRATDAGL
jgi:16S rRNA (adenine1518-N6/adenine1519-N6)-dimethyltransferase